ncbi:MAG: transketolase C-terminal domain-containing protein [Candidatus Hydrogenedentota bacterium]
MSFPIGTSRYKPLSLDLDQPELDETTLEQLNTNIQIVRDTIIFFTAVAGARGLGGHTGGAYSIVPEVLIADGFMRESDSVYPAYFDEAGHRVAIQYAMSAFNGVFPFEKLLHYREANSGLYGHPEYDPELGIAFSSGRLGHMWPFVNGVAMANPEKAIVLFGSDGSQQEGNNAEAARLAVAQGLNVKLFIDDNNVTIAGHPQDYLPGYDITKTLEGHGLTVDTGDGEDIAELYRRMQKAFATDGPVALVNKRPMAPGVPGVEGTTSGHDVIGKDAAVAYLELHGLTDALDQLNSVEKVSSSATYLGSSDELSNNRGEFGNIMNGILDAIPEEKRIASVLVIDSDLEGSTGLKNIHVAHPEVYKLGGIMERGNFSAAAGFGFDEGKQGVFSTFSAFLEMIISEATMARLNESNVLCHFSHAGVDDMADNTCHFGINIWLAHSGIQENDTTRLYFPADAGQMKPLLESVFTDPGIRYVFSTRSKVPYVLKEDGSKFYDDNYKFEAGKDDVIREGTAGYVVAYGEMLYRALDAVEKARADGIDVGLINKACLNTIDEDAMAKVGTSPFALIVEGQNVNTGLGMRYGTQLLERGLTPKYAHMGIAKLGAGGLSEHIIHQGLAPSDILGKIEELNG